MTLDSIPKAIKGKVVKCAKERKNMLFVGGKESQGKALANYAHESVNKLRCKECFIIDYRLYGNRQEFLEDIKTIQHRGFFLNDLLNVEKNKITKEGGRILSERDNCPPPSYDEDEILINTLFIDNLNLLDPDADLIRSVFGLTLTKRNDRGFKPLIIIHSDKPFPNLLKKGHSFEEIKIKKVKVTRGKLQKGGKGKYLPDDKLKPLLKEILKESRGSGHKLTDLVAIAEERIEKKYGLRKRKKDFKKVPYYRPSKLRMFLSKLENTGKLR